MGLFRKKGRSDIDAWAKVMIQGYKKGMPIDKALLEQATDQSIRNDCRIIRESVQIVMRSSDYEVREERKKLIEERYQHLKTLLPFADADQLKLYDEAMEQMINHWCTKGYFPVVKVRTHVRIKRKEFEAWLEKRNTERSC